MAYHVRVRSGCTPVQVLAVRRPQPLRLAKQLFDAVLPCALGVDCRRWQRALGWRNSAEQCRPDANVLVVVPAYAVFSFTHTDDTDDDGHLQTLQTLEACLSEGEFGQGVSCYLLKDTSGRTDVKQHAWPFNVVQVAIRRVRRLIFHPHT